MSKKYLSEAYNHRVEFEATIVPMLALIKAFCDKNEIPHNWLFCVSNDPQISEEGAGGNVEIIGSVGLYGEPRTPVEFLVVSGIRDGLDGIIGTALKAKMLGGFGNSTISEKGYDLASASEIPTASDLH